MSIEADTIQAQRGRNALEAAEGLSHSRSSIQAEIMTQALQAVRDSQLTPDTAYLYWMQLDALDRLFRRLQKEIIRGKTAGERLAEVHGDL